jgi:hypothetical protein
MGDRPFPATGFVPITHSRMRASFVLRVFALALMGVAAAAACRTQSSDEPPQTAATVPDDGGLPIPPPSTRRGVIVPSDTGMMTGPSGAGVTPGENGGSAPTGLSPPGGSH